MASHFDLAVLGADDPLGEALLKLLEEREIPIGRLYPLSLDEEGESSVAFNGRDWPCQSAAGFDFGQVQAVLGCASNPAARHLLRELAAQRPTLPLRQEALDRIAAVAVARVLTPLHALADVIAAEAVVALPVARAGKAGVEELSLQTRNLFNMESPDPEVFPVQVAFNLMPLAADEDETAMEEELLRLGFDVAFSSLQAPLFFGAAVMLHGRTGREVDIESLRLSLRNSDGITLMESPLPAGIPTPATDAVDSDDVFIGRIRVAGRHCKFWLVFDPIRLEAARLADTLENWIEMPANSMLT